MDHQHLLSQLQVLAKPEKAAHLMRFFKTAKGQYAEGDIFWGIPVPQLRALAKDHMQMVLAEVEKLLNNPVHEVRMCALLVLVQSFAKAEEDKKKAIIELYLSNTRYINNWDLVDLSVNMLGQWLVDKDRSLLYSLADSKNMWEQRIAVVSCNIFIRKGDFKDILALCQKLMGHKHDLMHKAQGWMLREVGKKDKQALLDFLSRHSAHMPRTMLRYSIERFEPDERSYWLKKDKK